MGQDTTKYGPSAAERADPRFKPLWVKAVVYDLGNSDKIVAEHVFDFNDPQKRIWFLEKCLIWACLNKHAVEMCNVKDDD